VFRIVVIDKLLTSNADGFGMSDTREALREYYGVSEGALIERIIMAMVDVSLIDYTQAKGLVKKIKRVDPLKDDRREG